MNYFKWLIYFLQKGSKNTLNFHRLVLQLFFSFSWNNQINKCSNCFRKHMANYDWNWFVFDFLAIYTILNTITSNLWIILKDIFCKKKSNRNTIKFQLFHSFSRNNEIHKCSNCFRKQMANKLWLKLIRFWSSCYLYNLK